jgi:hypothetical protein
MAYMFSGTNSQHRDHINYLEDGWVVYVSGGQVQVLIITVPDDETEDEYEARTDCLSNYE